MELALYCPEYGYYEKDSYSPGRDGDFYTSVSVGSLFGELLAFQFDSWHTQANATEPLQLVETGAHDGALAIDILNWFQKYRAQIFERLEYCILESSLRRQIIQGGKLQNFAEKVCWQTDIDSLPRSDKNSFRIIFSNEFLDALPVHRLGWDAQRRQWFEWGVKASDGKFVWGQMALEPSTIADAAELIPTNKQLLTALPDQFSIEICPAAIKWWRRAAGNLGKGKLLTFDYGFCHEDLLSPARTDGTLRAYYKHRLSSDILAQPGEQDLTAHVNLSALQEAGEAQGLVTDCFMSQERFLGEIAARAISDPAKFGNWTAQRTRQLQTLTHPEFFGNRFRVLVQSMNNLCA
jgi:SAM-dependent MidA family methyltransferase